MFHCRDVSLALGSSIIWIAEKVNERSCCPLVSDASAGKLACCTRLGQLRNAAQGVKRDAERRWGSEHPTVDTMVAEALGPRNARLLPRSPKLMANGALMTCR